MIETEHKLEKITAGWLRPGERLDDLLIGGRRLIQHTEQFCFSLDAVLLAHFTTVKTKAKAVDLGAGSGVLGLLLTALGAAEVTGVELNPQVAERAERSIALNKLGEQLRVLTGDLRQIKELLPGGCWDLVVSNPPYRSLGSGYLNPSAQMAIARHELSASLLEVVAAARHLLKYRGRFAMVHLPERLVDITAALRAADLEPKRLQLVCPRPGRKPNLLLIESVRGARPGLEVLPLLSVYGEDGEYSPVLQKWYAAT